MEAVEVPAMIAALVLMFAAVGAKVITAQLINHMKTQISQVTHLKQAALGRLRTAQSQRAVAEQNKNMLIAKKTKLSKKLVRLQAEMIRMESEEKLRRQRSEMRKVE